MIRADTVCRRTAESVFVWNPLVSIADLKGPEMLFQSVLNFGLFWPLGWYFSKRIPVKKALLWGAGISLALELLRWLLRRGYFDSLDALLYWAGIAVGYGQAKLIGRAFFNRKQKPGYTAQRQSKTAIGVLAFARTPICYFCDGF